MQVAVFGGSFNPPHMGHLLAATYVLATHDVGRVLVVPVFKHPFVKVLAPFDDRVEMCRLAVGWIPGVEVSSVEGRLKEPSWTVRTLAHLAEEHPDWKLRLLIGADVLDDAKDWQAWEKVIAMAPPILLGRAGVNRPDAPPALLPAVSSTTIRALLSRGAPGAELERLLPRAVKRYIDDRGLYR